MIHSHCAYCQEPSVWTVGPAITWQSARRITQDVCDGHVLQAVRTMQDDGVGFVMVGKLRQRFVGVNHHTA